MDQKETKQSKQTKKDFVLAQPKSMLAADVVKKAEEQGVKLTAGYVHTIRYMKRRDQKAAKEKAAAAATTPRRGPGRPKKVEIIPIDPSPTGYGHLPRYGKDFSYGVRKVTPPSSSANLLAEAIDKLVETRVRALFAELAAELRS